MTALRVFTVLLLGWYWIRIAEALYLGASPAALAPYVAEQIQYMALGWWLVRGLPKELVTKR